MKNRIKQNDKFVAKKLFTKNLLSNDFVENIVDYTVKTQTQIYSLLYQCCRKNFKKDDKKF